MARARSGCAETRGHTVRFGFYLPNQDPPRAERIEALYTEILDMAAVGDELGFTSCVASEHHGREDGYIPSPLILSSAVAARTRRIEPTTGVMLLPLWHPIRVAEDSALIDIISGGRFAIGCGLGLVAKEFALYGLTTAQAVGRFEESVDIMRLAWSEGTFDYDGEHFQLQDASVTPKPLQAGGPHIRIGGQSEKAIRRAGRIGDAWLTDPLHGLEAMKQWSEVYRAAAEEAGRPARVHLMRDCWITDDDEQLHQEWGRHLEDDWRYYYDLGFFRSGRFNPDIEPWLDQIAGSHELTFDRLRRDRVIVGSVAEVRDDVTRWIDEIRPDQLNLRFRFPHGPSHARVLEVMRTFAEEVMPAFSDAGDPS